MKTAIEVAREFILKINSGEWKEIEALLIDTVELTNQGQSKRIGVADVLKYWQNILSEFPDYQIQIQHLFSEEDKAMVYGKSYGSAGERKTINNSFLHSFSIYLHVENEKIKSMDVMEDIAQLGEITERLFKPKGADAMKVRGFGGVFFKSPDIKLLTQWYDEHLGTRFGENPYQTFKWRERNMPGRTGRTEFSLFKADTDYFAPSESAFMLNFRVADLEALLEELRHKGVRQIGKTDTYDYGKFAWIMDPDGNKIELWQPVDEVLENYDKEHGL
jgi:predicted enzyme related to lactoylglutathione lyase/predicted ester cyclase